MIHSARLRLTLWYIALLMALSLIFSGILFHFANHELAEVIHRRPTSIGSLRDNDVQASPEATAFELQARSNNILRDLIIFNGATLIVASGACYFLATRTLLPIEEAHRKQGRFVADVSHELRTPLAALQVQIEATLLQTTRPRSIEAKTLKSNLEEVGRLERLTDTLLSLAKDDTKANTYRSDILKVGELLALANERMGYAAKEKAITVKIKPSNVLIRGDFDAILQVVTAILDNAIKYSPKKSTITIGSTAAKKFVHITISDQGIGIKPAELPHVFDRFYRSDEARSHSGNDGLGLGLSLAKSIVDAHGGQISVSNNKPNGTKATITLPQAS